MANLLNKTFFNFTIGFMMILLIAFVVAAGVSFFDASKDEPELVELEANYNVQEGQRAYD